MNGLSRFGIAIVDDNAIVRRVVANYLRANDIFISFEAINGKECIDRLEEMIWPPNLIILDLEMPVMDGFKTATILRQRWPNIKIVCFSSLVDLETSGSISRVDADYFLPKSTKLPSIVGLIKSISWER